MVANALAMRRRTLAISMSYGVEDVQMSLMYFKYKAEVRADVRRSFVADVAKLQFPRETTEQTHAQRFGTVDLMIYHKRTKSTSPIR